jgi:hypothetical protein
MRQMEPFQERRETRIAGQVRHKEFRIDVEDDDYRVLIPDRRFQPFEGGVEVPEGGDLQESAPAADLTTRPALLYHPRRRGEGTDPAIAQVNPRASRP